MLFAMVGAQGCSTATAAGCGVGIASGVALAGIAAGSSEGIDADDMGVVMLGGGIFGVVSGCTAAIVADAIARPKASEFQQEPRSEQPVLYTSASPSPAVAVTGPLNATGQPPATAAGFTLGADVPAAEARCTGAGHAWEKLTDRQFSCSGAPVDVGAPAKVKLTTCSGLVCKVTVNVSADGAGWSTLMDRFNAISTSLEGSHGNQYERETRPLKDCTAAASECFATGRVRRTVTWRWSNRQSASLLLTGGTNGATPWLGVVYSTAAYLDTKP
jgi:hypothetical protein